MSHSVGKTTWTCYCDWSGDITHHHNCPVCGRTQRGSYWDSQYNYDKAVWKCICTYSNSTSVSNCRSCRKGRGASLVAKATPKYWDCVCKQRNDYSLFACNSCWKMKNNPMKWHCDNCGIIQAVKIDTCRCGSTRPKTIASAGSLAKSFAQVINLTTQSMNKLSAGLKAHALPIEGATMSKESLNQQCANQVLLAFTGSPLAKSTLLEEAYHTVLEAEQHASKPAHDGWKNKATHLYWDLVHDLYIPENMQKMVSKCWESAQSECPGNKTVKEHTINLVVDRVYSMAYDSVPYEYKGLIKTIFEEVDQTAVATRICDNYI